MKKLQNAAAEIFILCVVILASISILGVWEVFAGDVITKSFETVGLLAVVSIIIIGAGRFMDSRQEPSVPVVGTDGTPLPAPINPLFTQIRHATVVVLIISLVLLAFFGVLAIWEVMSATVMHKSVSSMAILVFSSLIIVAVCLEREQHKLLKHNISGGAVVLFFILVWTVFTLIF